jgi:hypothetical protein
VTQTTGPGEPPTSVDGRSSSVDADVEGHVIDLATPAWCWARLLSTTEGVLSSLREKKARGVAVSYTVGHGQVLIPIASFSAGRLLAGSAVTLGLSGRAEDGLRWVVRATGVPVLSVLAGDSLTASRNSHPARSSEPEGVDALLLRIDRLRGYRETPLRTSLGTMT